MTDTGVIYDWSGRAECASIVPTGNENVELLAATMTHIDEHPDELDQSSYARHLHHGPDCGTSFCYAGHALHIRGYQPDFDSHEWDGSSTSSFVAPDGSRCRADYAAREELGLTEDQGYLLFNTSNGVERLRQLVAVLTKGAYVPPGWAE
jgi:hypothetical protein